MFLQPILRGLISLALFEKKGEQSFDKQIHNLSKMKKNKTIRKNMELQYSSKVCEKKDFIGKKNRLWCKIQK